MEIAEFTTRMHELAERHEAGDTVWAITACEGLLADPSVPDLDRSIVAINLATLLQAKGASAVQVEAAYDQAIRLEHRWLRCYAREHKVAWLAQVGRTDAAATILDDLLEESWLQLADRDRIRRNLAVLHG